MERDSFNIQAIIGVIFVIAILAAVPSIISMFNESVDDQVGTKSMVEEASYIIYKDGDYTCAKNGTTGRIEYRNLDASYVLQTVINSTSGSVFITKNNYVLSSTVYLDNSTNIVSNGAEITSPSNITILTTKIHYPNRTSLGIFNGTPLASDAYQGNTIIEVADATQFVDCEYVYIVSLKKWRGLSYDGEIAKVLSITGTTITLNAPLFDTYLVSENATAYPYWMFNDVHISGITFVGGGKSNAGIGINLYGVHDASVKDCALYEIGSQQINVLDSINVVIDNIRCVGARVIGSGYGVIVGAGSFHVSIENSYFEDCQHGFTTGQGTIGVPRHISLIDSVFVNTYTERQHPSGDFVTYRSCVFQNTILFPETPNCAIIDSTFVGQGIQIGSSTGRWSNITNLQVIGNKFIMQQNTNSILISEANGVLIDSNKIVLARGAVGNAGGIMISAPLNLDASNHTMDRIVISNNEIQSANLGIYLNTAYSQISNLSIISNKITSLKNVIECGANPHPIKSLSIIGNVINGKATYSGISFSTKSLINNAIIDGNSIYGATYPLSLSGYNNHTMITNNKIYGGYVHINTDYSVQGTVIEGNYIDAPIICINIAKTATDLKIINNYLIGHMGASGYDSPLEIGSKSSRIYVANNVIFNSGQNSIRTYAGCNNVTFENNYLSSTIRGFYLVSSNDIKLSNNVATAATKVFQSACLRVVFDGVGTNGENDPASAGEWKGFGYEGLFVKWNSGATHYLSVYRGGAWFDMTLA